MAQSPNKRCFRLLKRKRYGLLSNRNKILIFLSVLPDIPRKISVYLQIDLPSGANTQIMKGLHNTLNINDLCLRGISSHCNMPHFGLRKSPFQRAKWAISHHEMGLIGTRNGQYQKVKCIISDYIMRYMKSRYAMKWPQMCPI